MRNFFGKINVSKLLVASKKKVVKTWSFSDGSFMFIRRVSFSWWMLMLMLMLMLLLQLQLLVQQSIEFALLVECLSWVTKCSWQLLSLGSADINGLFPFWCFFHFKEFSNFVCLHFLKELAFFTHSTFD